MSEFLKFLDRLVSHLGLSFSVNDLAKNNIDEDELAAAVLSEINKFLYQQHVDLENEYISEFHKYWESHHEKILRPYIGEEETLAIAKIIEKIYSQNSISVQLNTLNLTSEQIANVRFFTAIQDFKIDISAKTKTLSRS